MMGVGPRPLPAAGTVTLWIDTGSAWGYEKQVPVDQLFLADSDNGQGTSAIYVVRPLPAPEDVVS